MHKAQLKITNNVHKALGRVEARASAEVEGFKELRFCTRWDNFPASLRVVAVFESERTKELAQSQGQDLWLRKRVQQELLKVGVVIRAIQHTLLLDSEEACEREHAGDWEDRLQGLCG